jgi:hypothetical protein
MRILMISFRCFPGGPVKVELAQVRNLRRVQSQRSCFVRREVLFRYISEYVGRYQVGFDELRQHHYGRYHENDYAGVG